MPDYSTWDTIPLLPADAALSDEDVELFDELTYVVEGEFADESLLHSNEFDIVVTGDRPLAPTVEAGSILRNGVTLTLGAASSPVGLPLVKREVWLERDGLIIFSVEIDPTDLELVIGSLPSGTALVAYARDYDEFGHGASGSDEFTTLSNAPPPAPTITSPLDGATIDLTQSLLLDGTTVVDPDGDPVRYFWRRRFVGGTEWNQFLNSLLTPGAIWAAAVDLQDQVGQLELQLGASDGGEISWSSTVTLNVGFDTISHFEDFSNHTRGALLPADDWEIAQLEHFNPRAPIQGITQRAYGAHGGTVLEYDCGGDTNIYQRKIAGHWWTELGNLYLPSIEAQVSLFHTWDSDQGISSRHIGFFLCMGGLPLVSRDAKGYAVYLGVNGVSGLAYQGDGAAPKNLNILSNSIPILDDGTPYRVSASIAVGPEVAVLTLRRAYLDWRDEDGPFAGANPFGTALVPTREITLRVRSSKGVLLGTAVLQHIPSVPWDTFESIQYAPTSGFVGIAVSDWPGSVQVDWVAARSVVAPQIPTERAETIERWRTPYLGENFPTNMIVRWDAVIDPQLRPVLTRLERRNREESDDWEEILQRVFIPDNDVCSWGPIDMTFWRQSRGWQLAVSHSFDDGETWSERVITERFIVDRSGGTASTGFSDMVGWFPIALSSLANWEQKAVSPPTAKEGLNSRNPSKHGIFASRSHSALAWANAGIRSDSGIMGSFRVNANQTFVGFFIHGVEGGTLFAATLGEGSITVGTYAGGLSTHGGASAALTLVSGAVYHAKLIAERNTHPILTTVRFAVWRDGIQTEDEAVLVSRTTLSSRNYTQGLQGLASRTNSIADYGAGRRLREVDNVSAFFLEPLPDDRPELPSGENPIEEPEPIDNPEEEPNEPPPFVVPPDEIEIPEPYTGEEPIEDPHCVSPWLVLEPRQDDELWSHRPRPQ